MKLLAAGYAVIIWAWAGILLAACGQLIIAWVKHS